MKNYQSALKQMYTRRRSAGSGRSSGTRQRRWLRARIVINGVRAADDDPPHAQQVQVSPPLPLAVKSTIRESDDPHPRIDHSGQGELHMKTGPT